MKQPLITVIVPIFGVEKYIAHCAESLMNQTLTDIEYIFVNDCTKDNSINILNNVIKKYPARNVTILNHESNRGLPSARNTGLANANGKYVFHCDSDDYLEEDALECLYNKAQETNADIVWCDFFESYTKEEIYHSEPEFQKHQDAIKAMLSNKMKYNVWNKLIKRSLYSENHILFPEGKALGEDLTIIKLFVVSRKTCYLPKACYHYVRCNTSAMTQTWTQDKVIALLANVEDLDAFIQKHKGGTYNNELAYLKLWLKLQFLLTDGTNGLYSIWNTWFPESNKLIQTLPNANKRIKSLMLMATKKQWWFVWLHYWLICRLFYSFKYRNHC